MEIKIGVQHSGRELMLESTQTADEVTSLVEAAVTNSTLLSLIDEKGRLVIVPGDRIAFVEVGAQEGRKVGFST